MLIELLIIVIVLVISFVLLDRYIVPVIPAPWGRILEAIIAFVVIIFLLNKYVGLGL